MKKKVLSVLPGIALMMNGASVYAAEGDAPADVETVTMYCMNMGVASEYSNVVEAVNAISVPEIGVELNLVMLDIGQWFEQYSMLISGSESIDLMPNFGDAMAGGVRQGAFMDLTDLIQEYGTDIETYIPEQYMDAFRYGDGLYAIPSSNIYAQYVAIVYDADLADELGIDVSSVKRWKTGSQLWNRLKQQNQT